MKSFKSSLTRRGFESWRAIHQLSFPIRSTSCNQNPKLPSPGQQLIHERCKTTIRCPIVRPLLCLSEEVSVQVEIMATPSSLLKSSVESRPITLRLTYVTVNAKSC